MSILGSIMSSILGSRASAAPPTPAPHAEERRAPVEPAASAASPIQVDVAAVLDKLVEEADQKLDWRRSIVDLMKLLELDSSLAARKTLAKELSYSGDTKDSAAMNVWLHRQVMVKLEQNGGKVPADLVH